MAIPTDRSVIGRDLQQIKEFHGLSVADCLWLFGNMSITKWTQIKQKADEPLTDPTLALFVRFLDAHPECIMIQKMPDANEIFDTLNQLLPVSQKTMSIMLGNEESAAYRWRKVGTRQPPMIGRLMLGLKTALLMQPDQISKLGVINEWNNMVATEGRARGVNDVFTSGSWVTESARTKRRKEHEDQAAMEKDI